jgi:hypothetical protein
MADSPSEANRVCCGDAGSAMAMSIAIGVAIGAAMDNLALWLALGVAFGACVEGARTRRRKGNEGQG